MRNKPQEAAVLLESALVQEPRNEKIYLYLGIAYEQMKNYDKAIAIMEKGLEAAILYKDQLLFNIGNSHAAKGENDKAVELYSRALEVKGTFSDAYLNRANVEVKLDKFDDALRDYRLYLAMEPTTPQRPKIEEMMRLIESVQAQRIAEAERERLAEEERKRVLEEQKRLEEERRLREEEERRIAEEEQKRIAEEQKRLAEEKQRLEEEEKRIAEEKRRLEEEARQKALMDEVLKSLQMSAEDASHLSAEKEDIIEDRDEVDIDG